MSIFIKICKIIGFSNFHDNFLIKHSCTCTFYQSDYKIKFPIKNLVNSLNIKKFKFSQRKWNPQEERTKFTFLIQDMTYYLPACEKMVI